MQLVRYDHLALNQLLDVSDQLILIRCNAFISTDDDNDIT